MNRHEWLNEKKNFLLCDMKFNARFVIFVLNIFLTLELYGDLFLFFYGRVVYCALDLIRRSIFRQLKRQFVTVQSMKSLFLHDYFFLSLFHI